jgi:hypothetical protein
LEAALVEPVTALALDEAARAPEADLAPLAALALPLRVAFTVLAEAPPPLEALAVLAPPAGAFLDVLPVRALPGAALVVVAVLVRTVAANLG